MLNKIQINNQIYLSQKSNNVNILIYTESTQQSNINLQVNNVDVNIFALFGFSLKNQLVSNSIINISLTFEVFSGALLCIQCDLEIRSSTLVFVASGRLISGLIIESKEKVEIYQSFVQYRISSANSSGLVNVINQSLTIFLIQQCKLAGSNLVKSDGNGYISSSVLVEVQINVTQFDVCVDATSRFGKSSNLALVIGNETFKCDMCDTDSVVYGLCQSILAFSELVNGMYECVYPFQFAQNTCSCVHGYLLNGTKCVNVIESITNMSKSDNSGNLQQIQLQINNLQQSVSALDQNIIGNASSINDRISLEASMLEQFILSNYSKSEANLIFNTQKLDQMIFNNISAIRTQIQLSQIVADANLLLNTTVLDWRIFNNVSSLNQLFTQLNDTVYNLSQQVNCTSTYGHSMLNGSCVQVSCAIPGQQSINGICQCTIIHSIVQDGICKCPSNSEVVGGACVCSLAGQVMQNGACICSTAGAFMIGNTCACGLNQVNVSNTCTCPQNTVLIDGVCTCNQAGQIIISGKCQCPNGQKIVYGVCQYIIDNADYGFVCSQQVFTTTFDVQSVTSQVSSSSNFSSGYVFKAATVIQNAFVDVADNVYSTMQSTKNPLFESQSAFNNIKIQFGAQKISSGSIVSDNNQIEITQMNIVSKYSTELQVIDALNILQKSSSSTSISKLLVNLSFSLHYGNITLINNLQGTANITNYQVSGRYQSYSCVSLISLVASSATILVDNLNFMPSIFCIGNQSSYLFSSVKQSSIQLCYIALIVGISTKYLSVCSLYDSAKIFQFAGIVTNSIETNLTISNIVSSSFQNYNLQQVKYSGVLIGLAMNNTNIITIRNACMLIVLAGGFVYDSGQFIQFGIVGYNDGNLYFKQSNIYFDCQLTSYNIIGLVGYQTKESKYSETNDIIATLILNKSTSANVGTLFGCNFAQTKQINNILVRNSTISSSNFNGGLVGQLQASTIVQNVTIHLTNINSSNQGAGGLFGYVVHHVTIQNATIDTVRVSATNFFGILVGQNSGSYSISNSKSVGINYLNKDLQRNCASFSSIWSATQC
ncbi:Conserved_hypothetical protein [Hexamita inflata]|uniref:Uncharacterized protein n=1 Tax=Hexamita inflata TaxID=28002 RepID=A0AA86UTA0_9EUKA|nr:Conserved hypothetical protein [Hexamita inflata]